MNYLRFILVSIYIAVGALLLLCSMKSCDHEEATEIETIEEEEEAVEEETEIDDEEAVEVAETIGHDGDVKITLLWNYAADIDLHVIEPNGNEIYFDNKSSSTGGKLDTDNRTGHGVGGSPAAENVYWETPPRGKYQVFIKYFAAKADPAPSGPCTVVVKHPVGGRLKTETFTINMDNSSGSVLVTTFIVE